MKLKNIIHMVLGFLFRTLSNLDVKGQEKIPKQGGCILVGNHIATLDGPLIFAMIPRDDATGLAASKHQRNPIYRWVVDHINGIWIDQNSPDRSALRAAANYIKNGGLLGIAPEGTRSPTHKLIEGKPGAAFLAAQVGDIPIVPAAVTGTEDVIQKLFRFRRPPITMTFGEPFTLPALERKDREASLKKNTDEIMCQIAALLPPEYRGFYANHPRLKELLGENSG